MGFTVSALITVTLGGAHVGVGLRENFVVVDMDVLRSASRKVPRNGLTARG